MKKILFTLCLLVVSLSTQAQQKKNQIAKSEQKAYTLSEQLQALNVLTAKISIQESLKNDLKFMIQSRTENLNAAKTPAEKAEIINIYAQKLRATFSSDQLNTLMADKKNYAILSME
ncbi:MAG: hypothetical protein CFE24_07555 [Flavobacterium sp. BFFFF2]|nr:MAG: hypothetical protein CFE24_07555 [Flavobacterium sp. BFFFF2]